MWCQMRVQIICAGFLTAFLTGILPARADAEWEAHRQERRKSYDALMQNVPMLEKMHARDVLQLNVEDRLLVLHTPLPTTPGDGYAHVKLPGLGIALVRVQSGSDSEAHRLGCPSNFQFTLNDYSRHRQITTLSVSGEQLSHHLQIGAVAGGL